MSRLFDRDAKNRPSTTCGGKDGDTLASAPIAPDVAGDEIVPTLPEAAIDVVTGEHDGMVVTIGAVFNGDDAGSADGAVSVDGAVNVPIAGGARHDEDEHVDIIGALCEDVVNVWWKTLHMSDVAGIVVIGVAVDAVVVASDEDEDEIVTDGAIEMFA